MTYDPRDECGCRGHAGCPTCDVLTRQYILNSFPSLYNHPGLIDFSPPDEWLPVILELSEKLSQFEGLRCVQVKTKLGQLRYYTEGVAIDNMAQVYKLIREAEIQVANLEKRGKK